MVLELGRQIWFVRHGNRLDFVQPAWFCTALYPYDPPLCPRGHRQAQDLGDRLAQEQIQHLFVSPFLRTRQTAQYCAQGLKLVPTVLANLGEWQNPRWMKRPPRIHRQPPGQNLPPYPETMAQVQRRSIQTLQYLLRQYSGNLLLIGHKVPLGICLSYLLGQPEPINLEVCALNQVIWVGDRWRWHRQNETVFLREPGLAVAAG
ncbi:MAG: histidine phosphatase family protein [Synechococcus sp.]|nr:histidine phosphatase family protein [Synechococcus sp.]